jgi:choline kinase
MTTALLLAAGIGSRLYPLTRNEPKCLTIVNAMSILERLTSSLNQHGFKRMVVVTGHLENRIKDFLGNQVGDITIDYIFSPLYKTTNNIYSLWMAREIINEPFLLLESDLVFDESLLDSMLYPDRIAVKYKTVNIYSISLASWHCIVKKLDQHISDGKVNDYYETVFAEMIADGSLTFKIVSFDGKPWYEIDTLEDLAEAEKLFSSDNYRSTEIVTLFQPDFFNIQLKLFSSDNYTCTKIVTLSQSDFFNIPLINAVTSPREATGILSVAK